MVVLQHHRATSFRRYPPSTHLIQIKDNKGDPKVCPSVLERTRLSQVHWNRETSFFFLKSMSMLHEEREQPNLLKTYDYYIFAWSSEVRYRATCFKKRGKTMPENLSNSLIYTNKHSSQSWSCVNRWAMLQTGHESNSDSVLQQEILMLLMVRVKICKWCVK